MLMLGVLTGMRIVGGIHAVDLKLSKVANQTLLALMDLFSNHASPFEDKLYVITLKLVG